MEKFNVVGIGGCGGNIIGAWQNSPLRLVHVVQELELASNKLAYILTSDENWHIKLLDSLDDVVCLIAGLGGGTGTEGIQQVAQLAKAQGKTVYAFVTTPFKFEAGKRNHIAKEAISALQDVCNDVFIFPNDELHDLIKPNTSPRDVFNMRSNQILDNVIQFIS